MQQARKDQLNKKLHQIFEASGRSEDKTQDLLEERIFGHIYAIHEIKETKEYPGNEFDDTDKTFTLIEFGLYQEGEACIEMFDMPVSEAYLKQIEARIDTAYYKWIQAEPQWIKTVRLYDYYKLLSECTLDPSQHNLTEEDFLSMDAEDRDTWIKVAEWNAFLHQ